ncbi:MAG TPA: LPS assembly lipoprotein LptE [Steroidobacteraceae bacterium]|nr:LPS assembly lipoprotein LptE [Steroidobacteraceae bacterium]
MSWCERGFILLFALALAACGFHRQGVRPVSPVMKLTYLDARDERSDFLRGLSSALEANGATLAATRDGATAILSVERDETGQRVLSVSARNTPTEYEIYYTVTYSVTAGGEELLAPRTITLTRDYSFDEEALLAKQHEEEFLRESLARDLVSQVMRSLASL